MQFRLHRDGVGACIAMQINACLPAAKMYLHPLQTLKHSALFRMLYHLVGRHVVFKNRLVICSVVVVIGYSVFGNLLAV